MQVEFTLEAEKEYQKMKGQLQDFFDKHIEKLANMPPRRHMRFGLPYHVEDVTRQARLIYRLQDERLYVTHCFSSHKEYESWFRSFK